jgi:hypothetical protein
VTERIVYDATNVTRGVKDNGENPGYFYAPCKYCGKRLNVGNYPPVIVYYNDGTFGRLDVWCLSHKDEK